LRSSPHPREAARVLRWLGGEEVQRHLARRYGYAPTWQSLYEDAELQRDQPLLAVQRRALEGAVVRPVTPLYAQLSDVLQRQVNGLLSGGGSPAAIAASQGQSELVLRAAAGTTG
jgi:multiple sugar transport system substrate-binding protein